MTSCTSRPRHCRWCSTRSAVLPQGRCTMSDVEPLVLVVDDDAAVRNSVVECLRDVGIRTTTAADGAAALEAFHRENPDLVLLTSACRRWTAWKSSRRSDGHPA